MKSWFITILIILIALFITSNLVLDLPESLGIQNISIIWGLILFIMGVWGIVEVFKIIK